MRVISIRCGCWMTFWSLIIFITIPSFTVFAADTTPPTTPVVTDDGSATASSTTLHATWSASTDADSGVTEYWYAIGTTVGGTDTKAWTNAGLALQVTATGLTLTQAKTYYVGVKAKNGAGLWSAVGWSNGIKVDTTPPPAAGQPTEGNPDTDYNGSGSYVVSWSATTDPESALLQYELQEKAGANGAWTTLYTGTYRTYGTSNRLDKTTYSYQARSQNGAGTWGPYSLSSDGVLIDKTPPTAVTVTDDGAVTNSTTQLHATWTASTDAESGILDYGYAIGTTKGGTDTKAWTTTGLVLEVTATGLTLTPGKTYYVTVKARNNALLYSALASSDGIQLATDTTPPTLSVPTTTNVTSTGATVTWTTNEASTTQLDYGLTTSYGQTTSVDPTLVTTHTVPLTGLTPTTTYHARARSKDAAGNEGFSSDVSLTTAPPPDTTAPTGSITINGGAGGTNIPSVTLSLLATDNSGTVSQLRVSNDGSAYAAPLTYTTRLPWTLSAGEGTKTVYVQFVDPAGNWSAAASSTIQLDTTPPTISTLATTNLTATSVTLTFETSEPTVALVEYGLTTAYGATTPQDPSPTTTHQVNLSGLSPTTTYHARATAVDPVGNTATSPDASFTTPRPPDTTPPTGTITINDGAAGTNNPTVTLTLSATDDSGTVTSMRFSVDGTTYAPPEPYATTKPLTLDGTDGTKTVWVQFGDAAGNWSSAARATILLDTTPPHIQFTSPVDGDVLTAPSQ